TTRARELGEVVASAIEGRRLLDHPFYRRWEAGGLAEGELAAYAGQYRHFEAALPGWLATVADGLEGAPAELVAQNLADELGHPEPHLALFDRFAVAVGAPPAAAGPAAGELVATYR